MNHQIKLFGEALPTSPYGIPYFWFDSLSGTEKINELFEYHLIVKVRDEFNNPVHGYRGLEALLHHIMQKVAVHLRLISIYRVLLQQRYLCLFALMA